MPPSLTKPRLSLEYGRFASGRRRSLAVATVVASACLSFLAGTAAAKVTLSVVQLCVFCGSAGLLALVVAINELRLELRATGRTGATTRWAVAMSLALGSCGPLFARFDSPFHRWPVCPAIVCLPGLRAEVRAAMFPSAATRPAVQLRAKKAGERIEGDGGPR
jgi:hypothetical protein